MDKKVAYSVFRKTFDSYIGRAINYRNKVVCAVQKYRYPMTDYEENNMPKDLSTGETSATKKEILDQQIKLYVTKEASIKDNICKMYTKNWG